MSSKSLEPRSSPAEVVAGFMASFAIFASVISIIWHPLRLVLLSMLLVLIAAAMAPRSRIVAAAVVFAAAGFFFGMIVAVVFSKPLW